MSRPRAPIRLSPPPSKKALFSRNRANHNLLTERAYATDRTGDVASDAPLVFDVTSTLGTSLVVAVPASVVARAEPGGAKALRGDQPQ